MTSYLACILKTEHSFDFFWSTCFNKKESYTKDAVITSTYSQRVKSLQANLKSRPYSIDGG